MALDPGVLSEFKILIDAQTDKLQRSLRRQKAEMYKEGRDMAKTFNTAFSTVFGVGLSTAGVTMLVRSALNTADALFKQSKQINVTVEDLQRLNFAAQQSGIEQANFARGLELLNDRAFDASMGMSEQKRAFDQLGVSIRTANGEMKDTTTLLREVLESLSKMSDSSARIGLARDIFGRSGAAFLNLGGEDDLQALMNQRDSLGPLISTDEARRAEEFEDRMSALWTKVMAHMESMTMSLITALEKVEKVLTAPEEGTWWDKKLEQIANAFDAIEKSIQDNPNIAGDVGGAMESNQLVNAMLKQVAQMGRKTILRWDKEGVIAGDVVSPTPVPAGVGSQMPPQYPGAPGADLPGRMAMVDLSGGLSMLAHSIPQLNESVNHLADLWEGFTLPESVTGRFNPVPVSIDAVTIGANGPQAARASMGGRPMVVNNWYGANVASPVDTVRQFSAQSAMVPRGM